MTHLITPVILCGGSGTRLWPLSRADRPKQLLALAGIETMLQETVARATGATAGLGFEAPLIVAGEAYAHEIVAQIEGVGLELAALLLEPMGRNTAPAVALAAHVLAARGAGASLMLVMPSDHLIADVPAFHAAIAAAAPAAAAGRLVTFGIAPTEPATGYGYIEPAAADSAVRAVARFVEKPDAETAARYIAEGYFWNAGIFLLQVDAFLSALAAHAPDVAAAAATAAAAARRDGKILRPTADDFGRCPSISIDYAVMERSPAVSVVPVDMGWSDVGSWDALWKVSSADADGNVVRGAAALVGCRGSLVRNEGGPHVAALGLEDMIVVSTPDVVMVAPRARAEDVKKLVERVEGEGLAMARSSHEARAAWGTARPLAAGPGWSVRHLQLRPGAVLDLAHEPAATWTVASGCALFESGDAHELVRPGMSRTLDAGAGRLRNTGDEPLDLVRLVLG